MGMEGREEGGGGVILSIRLLCFCLTISLCFLTGWLLLHTLKGLGERNPPRLGMLIISGKNRGVDTETPRRKLHKDHIFKRGF